MDTRGCSEASHGSGGLPRTASAAPVTSHGRLDRGVARISGHIARGRTDLEHAFVADLHGAGFRTSGFADVPDACARDRHHPRVARFAVVRGDCCGALEGLTIR